ncbi:MAG: DUF1704 domain-containing protein [Proteobacteria bacterium]|nr:MAG: DUF1704 domain-containing protein [Pseudomonadota bacterium]
MKAAREILVKAREISHEIRTLQKDLRILSTLRWDSDFEAKYFGQKGAPTLESVRFNYKSREPAFKLPAKLKSLQALQARVAEELADSPDLQFIFNGILRDLANVAKLISKVGTEEFGLLSQDLWGSPRQRLSPSGPTILSVAERFGRNLNRVSDSETEKMFPKVLNSEGLASLLRSRLQDSHLIERVRVIVTDQMTADAAAGSDYVKIRKDAIFSIKDVDVLLYHEVYTHIVTGLNGRNQRYAKWLAFDSPRCSSTQEGMAVFLELLSGKTYPRRQKRIIDRIQLLGMIEAGEKPSQMYDWLKEMGYSHADALSLIMRAFRGSNPESKRPFTKDVSYIKGLIECFNFIHLNLIHNRYDYIHALYCGKMNVKEVPHIVNLIEQGVVESPRWIPPEFLDLDSLAGWFSSVIAISDIRDVELQTVYRTTLHPKPTAST